MKAVIIEDEAINVEDITTTLENISHMVEVVAILSSVKQAIQYFEEAHTYDIIFSDVQLGDGLSFDIFKNVCVTKPVIFCTAYDKYALEAFDNNGIAYILKPYNKTAIEKAVSKFVNLTEDRSYKKILEDLNAFTNTIKNEEKHVLVHHKDKIVPVAVDAIAMFYIENEVTKICCFNQSVYSVSQNLDDIEFRYTSKFFRANRQYLINKKAIKETENICCCYTLRKSI